jgi:hypothetical protein
VPGHPPAGGRRPPIILIAAGALVVLTLVVFGLQRLNREPEATPLPTAQPVDPGVAGTWQSNYGAVTLSHPPIDGPSPVVVTGFWIQAEDKRGQFDSGTFDPQARTLAVAYTEEWSGVQGTAKFTLSPDGSALTGRWTQQTDSGDWLLSR